MSHVWAIVLGLVQGLAEFLPISSTAHLRLVPWVFGIEGHYAFLSNAQQAAAFDIALHAGSFIAILIALWPDWVGLVKGAVARDPFKLRFLGFLVVTSVPGAIFGALLESKIETYSTPSEFRWAPVLVGAALMSFGVILWAVDHWVQRQEPLERMSWTKSLGIGLAQALALIPGVSRSGATMTAGRAFGLSRDATARYSFMAALPIIGGAAVFGLRHVPIDTLASTDWVLGFVAAALSSVVFMRWMLGYVKNHSFAIFMFYRLALGAFVLVLFFFRG